MSYEFECRVAVQAVLQACRLCQTVRTSLTSKETMDKEDKSPVTVADFGAQAVINLNLMEAFPNDPITAEEDSANLRTPEGANIRMKILRHVSAIFQGLGEEEILAAIDRGNYKGGPGGRFWTLDPIDGTKGFLRGDQYAIALALIENGEVILGVLGCPNFPVDDISSNGRRGCLFVASKNAGATMRLLDDTSEKRIKVTEISNPKMASFCESFESGHSSHSDAARITEILGVTAPPVRIDSQCKYATIARGDASIYLRLPTRADYVEKIWDHAAGWIIVKEAGGEVTDVYGNPLDFSAGQSLSRNTGVVATNGKIHSEVISAVRQVLENKV
ncbi:MAG TPA: 3'(2'),5'-bisphosphate nucleotidase [Thermodesulfobacteriota bacterium]|nr:3'(2'),5'-bisphosphate nucleotidase [Thermodesulfobacteriota bacterium]